MAALLPYRTGKRKAKKNLKNAADIHRDARGCECPLRAGVHDMAAPQCWLSLNPSRLSAGGDTTMDSQKNPPKKGDAERKDRLAEALRANLQKRKAQTRSRRAGDADKRPEGLPSAGKMQKE